MVGGTTSTQYKLTAVHVHYLSSFLTMVHSQLVGIHWIVHSRPALLDHSKDSQLSQKTPKNK